MYWLSEKEKYDILYLNNERLKSLYNNIKKSNWD
ncbi:MAG: hypothetical protein E7311_06910 [Clostridiales bacterium]|nr:hypothetical protein [Clostridiales bacterium]